MRYYRKRSFPKYYLDLEEAILECGPSSLTLRLKTTILMYDVTENQTIWIKLIQQHEQIPSWRMLVYHVQRISKFLKMATLPREFTPNSTPFNRQQCLSLRMHIFTTTYKRFLSRSPKKPIMQCL